MAHVLSGFGEGADLGFQGLIVLALDLEFGLEFLYEEIEMGDLHAEFLDVGGWGTLTLRRLLRKRRLAGIRGQVWLGRVR